MSVFSKFHSGAFSRINPVQTENLARVLRDVLQRLDKVLGGPPYNLILAGQTFSAPSRRLLEDH
jgi:galactose-1-phosphate uridylyltransferase